MTTAIPEPGQSEFDVEHTFSVNTAQWRSTMPLAQTAKIKLLRSMFAKVELIGLEVEVRQNVIVGEGSDSIIPKGHIYVALIPSLMDTDAASGASKATVDSIPFKQTFPLSTMSQANMIFKPNLSGYELDLAQDPRRGAGPIAWLGNSGVRKPESKTFADVCISTWRMRVRCSGVSPLWF